MPQQWCNSGAPPAEWPQVTVQLPIPSTSSGHRYNELHTVERLLNAAAGLDYPHDRLEIQVLNDSTDATRRVAAQIVARLRRQRIDVVHVTRPERAGFKAGALAAGLAEAKGELIAIFDADFLPPPDFRHYCGTGCGGSSPTLPTPLSAVSRPVGAIACGATVPPVPQQWRNRDYSLFTQAQALGVDGHFVIEQTAQSRAGLFINFNGTAGVWRRACIEDAGGWQGDTLTEDLDLSYRAPVPQ